MKSLKRVSLHRRGCQLRHEVCHYTLKIIHGATYLGSICYGAPVLAGRATVGAVRCKLLQGQRFPLIFFLQGI